MALFVPRGKEKVVSVDQFLAARDTYATPHESFEFSSMLYKEPVAKETAKLVPSKNAYHATNHSSLSAEEAFSRRIRAALNKLTPSNSDIIIKEIISNQDTFSDANINIVVDLLFNKAISEAFFVRNYMNMISALSEEDQKRAGMFKVPSTSTMSNSGEPGASPTTESPVTNSHQDRVRRHLVAKAQNLFDELKSENTDGLDMEEAMALRQRRNANIQFVAELLKGTLLSIKVITHILMECLPVEGSDGKPVEYNDQMVEIAVELFRHTGKFLVEQEAKGDKHKDKYTQCLQYMETVSKIAKTEKNPPGISKRVWFKCQDIVDLQKMKWEKKQPTPEASLPLPSHSPQPPPYPVSDGSPPPYQSSTVSPAKDPRRQALPPEQLTEKVEEQLAKILRGVAEGKEEWNAVESALTSSGIANQKPPTIVFILTKFASISTSEEQRKLFTGLIPKYRYANSSSISRGIAWFIASALQNNFADDMPKLWDHCATFLVAVVPPVTMLTETAMITMECLDAIASEPSEKAQWGLTLLKVIDKYKEAMEAKEEAKKAAAHKDKNNNNKHDTKMARTNSTNSNNNNNNNNNNSNSNNNGGNFVINPDDLPELPSLSPSSPPPPPTPLPAVTDVLNAFIHRTPTPLHLVVCLDYVTAVQEWVGLRSDDIKGWIALNKNNDKAKNIIEEIQFLCM